VSPEVADAALAEPGVRPFDMTGRPMKGWLLVDADGHAEDGDLRRWVDGAWPTPAPCRPSSHASHPSRACAEYRPGGVEAMATIGLWLGAVGRGWSVRPPRTLDARRSASALTAASEAAAVSTVWATRPSRPPSGVKWAANTMSLPRSGTRSLSASARGA
jgi:hypothetical protein